MISSLPISLCASALLAVPIVTACSGATDPVQPLCASAVNAPLGAGDTAAAVQWNVLARDFVIKYRTDPSARPYAVLSAAQLAAASAVGELNVAACPSSRAAVAAASARALSFLFPAESLVIRARLSSQHAADSARGASSAALLAGDALGYTASASVMTRASSDGVNAAWTGTVPMGEGMWRSVGAPATPMLGKMTPWLLSSGDQFRPAPPPAYGSPAFNQALAEVRSMAVARTPEQVAIAKQWAMSGGTSRLQGHWNVVAGELLVRSHASEHEAAHALALLNLAMNDASIACFDAKYVYWLIRPSQADPAITLPIPLSNHPSYPSSHSCTVGAAHEALGALFPADAARLRAMADTINLSRLYGGVHYRFDLDTGMAIGQRVARLALEKDGTGGGLAALVR
jgi:hypothetical protein